MANPQQYRWTKNSVMREVLENGDVRDVSYCLRLLDKDDALALQEGKNSDVLRDMARKLKISPSSSLSIKQAAWARDLIVKANLHETLALIFNMMTARGDEILLGDIEKPIALPEELPEPSLSESMNVNWGRF